MQKDAKIYVAGHSGLLGSAIVRRLKREGYTNCVVRTHCELDLTRQKEVEEFFKAERPQYVFLAAAKVGGIQANTLQPADFIYKNCAIQTNVIHAAFTYGVKKLLFFGSGCMYPRESPQPMREEYLLSGYLEPTSEAYAIAKIMGVKMCQAYNRQYQTNFVCAIPSNIYGPDDHFDAVYSHVIPALLKKFHDAKEEKEQAVILWGTGNPKRDFIFIDDVVDACLVLMNTKQGPEVVNIGYGNCMSIKELAVIVKETIGYKGEIIFDNSRLDGVSTKSFDSSSIRSLGWQPKTNLREGLQKTYRYFIQKEACLR